MQRPDTVDHHPRETQRANILEDAWRVFARKGKAATMADVAQAAGVSQGLAYRYFTSKEQLYRELVEQALELAGLATAKHMHECCATPGQCLALLIRWLVEYHSDHL
jgi:AcrR family transcriptional regulator